MRSQQIELDPVICYSMDGLEFDYSYEKYILKFIYHLKQHEFAPKKVVINNHELTEFRRIDNPYRGGGIIINKAIVVQHLKTTETNSIDIYL